MLLGLIAGLALPAQGERLPGTAAAARSACPITTGTGLPGQPPGQRSFAAWRAAFERAAVTCGIRPRVAAAALQAARLDPAIARLDQRQAEYNSTFMGYLHRRVSDVLVQQGRARLQRHATLLRGIEARYGVAPEVLVALWGLESGFGANQGDTPVLAALATLAYDGRRRELYQRQLLAALRLLDAGDVAPVQLRGSWAGAMGQVQFMPTTFVAHALDADGDGRRDLWGSTTDALTSAANYLTRIGWRADQPWGIEVTLPPDFDPYSAELNVRRDTADWAEQGLRLARGGALADALGRLPARGAVVLPSGIEGPAFLVFDNFDAILEWNRSIFYALSVGYLAQRLAGGPTLVGRAPPGEQALSRTEVMRLQEALNALGLDAGEPDGMVGAQTRQALRRYQAGAGLTADAYPTPALIARIRAEARGEAPGALPATDRTSVRALQRGLERLGYDPGPSDGLMGTRTRTALNAYLSDRGQAPVARPSRSLVERIATEGEAVAETVLESPE
ncbi:lytic murein transglycosylase [uncultured Thiohalocapsa sp.]|uniref:lytic murein transglycosylase n=1 Tax=uncultured Thiohalocapsa sp. TaxID=768990 RepID=UPI0025D4E67F|nr:lytic murein transglycosylase [uncultured Thiohalocapsa sp.]